MYWPDVVALKQFYHSPLGHSTAALLDERIMSIWPPMRNETLVGIGYAAPYLSCLEPEDCCIAACMPAMQGAMYHAMPGGNVAAMVQETELPFADNSVNRVLLAHVLENTEQPHRLLQEAWRILAPGGRLLVMVPNRLGIWARTYGTPFSYGRPFSLHQLKHLIADSGFTPLYATSALFLPPTRRLWMMRTARAAEAIGRKLCTGFGGVLLMEAEKQIYATLPEPISAMRKHRLRAQAPQPALPIACSLLLSRR